MKYILLLCFSFTVFGACKKTSSVESYYRMTVDGASVNCDKGLTATRASSSGLIDIDGAWTGGSMRIELFNFKNAPG